MVNEVSPPGKMLPALFLEPQPGSDLSAVPLDFKKVTQSLFPARCW